MDGDTTYSIGELARRTGLTVKAIRHYADTGLVPPSGRTPAGYRRYDAAAAARLDLVRTLRDLGLDLATIRKVVDRDLSLSEVAGTHAEALDAQIRVLRLRRAVLLAVAGREPAAEELDLMHRFATLSAAERERLIADFLDSVFGGLDADPVFAGVARSLTPELPDDPEPAQVEAWVELAELSLDPSFRSHMRRLAEDFAAGRIPGEVPRPDIVATLRAHYTHPSAGVPLERSSGTPRVLNDGYSTPGVPLTTEADVARVRLAADPRRERYLELLSIVNGWPAPQSLAPVLEWLDGRQ